MTVRHICSWRHQSTPREEAPLELGSCLGKKLLLSGLLHKLDMLDPPSNDC